MVRHLYLCFIFLSAVTMSVALHAAVKGADYYCIILEANLTGTITYMNKMNESAAFDFIADETTVNIGGECTHFSPTTNTSVQTLKISFLPTNSSEADQQWSLIMEFSNDSNSVFKISDMRLHVTYPPRFNASEASHTYTLVKADDFWSVAQGTSGYSCASSSFELDENSHVDFKTIKALAFAQLKEPEFPADQIFENCITKTSKMIPAVVGICLAILVIAVLIAYLIGRSRARRQGYTSV